MYSKPTRQLRLLLLGVGLACLILVLAVESFAASTVRYLADDYCTACTVREMGVWQVPVHYYLTWSGRFTFHFLVGMAELGGPTFAAILPALTIVAWMAAAVWALLQWLPMRDGGHFRSGLTAFLLAGVLLVTTLEMTPNVVQSLYWRTGSLTYVAPLICMLALSGILGHARKRGTSITWPAILLSSVLAFLGSGCSETYAAVQTTILALLAIVLVIHLFAEGTGAVKGLLVITLSGLLGSLLGMAVVMAAPGNSVRQSFFSPTAGPWGVFVVSLLRAKFFLERLWNHHRVALALGIVLPLVVSMGFGELKHKPLRVVKWLILVFLLTPLVLLSAIVPAIWGMGGGPPDRAMIIPQFVIVVSLILSAWLIGVLLRGISTAAWFPMAFVNCAICLVAVAVLIWHTATVLLPERLDRAAEWRALATEWDQRDVLIREAAASGELDVVVPGWDCACGLEDIAPEPTHWVNMCASCYYGLDTLRSE